MVFKGVKYTFFSAESISHYALFFNLHRDTPSSPILLVQYPQSNPYLIIIIISYFTESRGIGNQ